MTQLGQFSAADKEFALLQTLEPPAKAAELIRKYREQIAEQNRKKTEPSHRFLLGAGLGFDSNVNGAPSDYQLDLFGGLFQTRISDESGYFSDLNAQYTGLFPVDDRHTLQFTAGAQSRLYTETELQPYSVTALQANGIWRYKWLTDHFVITQASVGRVFTEQPLEPLFDLLVLRAGVEQPVLTESYLSTGLSLKKAAYTEASNNDYAALKAEAALSVPVASWLLQGASALEREFADDRRDGGDAWRGRLQFKADNRLSNRLNLQLGVSYQRLVYDTRGFGFYNQWSDASREDDVFSGTAALTWIPEPDWYVTTGAEYRKQNSSIDFFNFDQVITNINVAYSWR
ncbi:hypothetical protein [Oceanospirillum linum]|nr:hypothetical protein [Oceanospirillum linum]